MAAKPGGNHFAITEQIFDDPVTGISFQFFAVPNDSDAPFRLRLFGNLYYVDHEYVFDKNGVIRGRETILIPRQRPTWLKEVKA